jgi:hypothetical protein
MQEIKWIKQDKFHLKQMYEQGLLVDETKAR